MKGIPRLAPITEPVKGMQVVWFHEGKSYLGNLVDQVDDKWVFEWQHEGQRAGNARMLSELKQIVVEYDTVATTGFAVSDMLHSEHKTLPLHPSDYQTVIDKIGQGIEFEIKDNFAVLTEDTSGEESKLINSVEEIKETPKESWTDTKLALDPQKPEWMKIFVKWAKGQYSGTVDGLQDFLEKNYLPPKERGGIPESEGDVMPLARVAAIMNNYDVEDDTFKHGYVVGYREAIAKKYTEEDLKFAYDEGVKGFKYFKGNPKAVMESLEEMYKNK